MSFNTMGVAELRQIAVEFGVVIEEADAKKLKKAELIEALDEDGVTFDQYKQFKEMREAAEAEAEEEEDEVVEEVKPKAKKAKTTNSSQMFLGETLLIKMDRENFSFQVPRKSGKGVWRWTKEHPFQAMSNDEASHVLDTFAGFRIATPTEAKEYYDGV